ncbi:polysaccharide deacetylase family protein [Bacillus sp. 165]|uniref:polysaccharide deacetylase family protein n=1 Tax=Bacillus sp. 165 TaxID=1529117 RepID=UPI001ADC7B90|nr:polysaccharide deacetylase family protein [Bacillus sp. 165]MBO9129395.1 polysaccharide deacetylase family protein [Bacillus sp. 165]
MKKIVIRVGMIILVIFLLLVSTYKLMNARSFQLFGELINHVETSQKAVALTFDDGPTENVDDILPLLEQYNAKATFFLIGADIEKHPEEAKKIAKSGHQIGNHSYSHQRMVFKSSSFVAEEIEKTDKLIRSIGYKDEIDFRPPFGKKLIALPYYLNKHNRDTIMWDVEPDVSVDQVAYVKKNVKNGSIILIHPMYDKTGDELKVIKGILQALSEEGYTFVTVNELQTLQGK